MYVFYFFNTPHFKWRPDCFRAFVSRCLFCPQRFEMRGVNFVDIDGIVDHHFLSFLFIQSTFDIRSSFITVTAGNITVGFVSVIFTNKIRAVVVVIVW